MCLSAAVAESTCLLVVAEFELGGDSVVAVGGAVVFVGMVVFVGDDGGCCVASLGGLGVRVGATTVYIGSVGKFVGMGVSLGVVVFVSLGVTVKISVAVSVVFLDSVSVNNAISHGLTPVNPRLYASKRLNKRVPSASAPSSTWLPAGCNATHP